MLKTLLTTPKKRAPSPPQHLSPAPRSPSPPPPPPIQESPPPASPPASEPEDPCPATPPMSLEETLFSGLLSRVHAENRALKAKNERLVEKAKVAKREREDAVKGLEELKQSLESKIAGLEEKNSKLKMRLKNADALLSKTELWFEAYVKLSTEATINHGIPTPGTSEAAAPSSKSGGSSSNGHGSDAAQASYPNAARAVTSPPPAFPQNGYPASALGPKQSITRRVTSEPLTASSQPRVHYSSYSTHPTGTVPAAAAVSNGAERQQPSAPLSRQNSQQQSTQRAAQQQQQQLGRRGSQQQLSNRLSQHEIVQRAAQHPVVQRTQGILQKIPVSVTSRRHSADQSTTEYWSSQFNERLNGHKSPTAPSAYAPPPSSTYYPTANQNTSRTRLPGVGFGFGERRRTVVDQKPRPMSEIAK